MLRRRKLDWVPLLLPDGADDSLFRSLGTQKLFACLVINPFGYGEYHIADGRSVRPLHQRYEAAGEFGPALLRAGIEDYETAMGYRGGLLVAAHRGRSVVRIEGSLFLKRFIGKTREARRERKAFAVLEAGPGPDPGTCCPLAGMPFTRRETARASSSRTAS